MEKFVFVEIFIFLLPLLICEGSRLLLSPSGTIRATPGVTLHINCSVKDVELPNLRWSLPWQNDADTVIMTERYKTVWLSNNILALYIRDVDVLDSGIYGCTSDRYGRDTVKVMIIPPNNFNCANKYRCESGQCIDKALVCDEFHKEDCRDGSDEKYCNTVLSGEDSTKEPGWHFNAIYSGIASVIALVCISAIVIVTLYRIHIRRDAMRRARAANHARNGGPENGRRPRRYNRLPWQQSTPAQPPPVGEDVGMAPHRCPGQTDLNRNPRGCHGNSRGGRQRGLDTLPNTHLSRRPPDVDITALVPPPYSEVPLHAPREGTPPPPYSTIERRKVSIPNIFESIAPCVNADNSASAEPGISSAAGAVEGSSAAGSSNLEANSGPGASNISSQSNTSATDQGASVSVGAPQGGVTPSTSQVNQPSVNNNIGAQSCVVSENFTSDSADPQRRQIVTNERQTAGVSDPDNRAGNSNQRHQSDTNPQPSTSSANQPQHINNNSAANSNQRHQSDNILQNNADDIFEDMNNNGDANGNSEEWDRERERELLVQRQEEERRRREAEEIRRREAQQRRSSPGEAVAVNQEEVGLLYPEPSAPPLEDEFF